MENILAFPQKVKLKIIIWSNNSTFRYTSRNTESSDCNRYLYTYVHNNIIHNSQKLEATQASPDGWTDKQNLIIHMVEYYSFLRRKEILTHVITWMNFEGIMVSEISQNQKKTNAIWLCFYEAAS